MPVLVENDGALARELSHALPSGTTTLKNLAELDQWTASGQVEYAVVLGPSVDLTTATEWANHYRMAHPATGIVLIRPALDNQIFTLAMQAGIGAVVAHDDVAGLASAVLRSRQTWEALNGTAPVTEDRDARVITIFSPKGGVGKTTIAVNLGIALAMRGSRVCLVDLDLSFGDVAITLQLVPEHTISEAADSGDAVDYSLLETLLTPYEHAMRILAAPTHPEGRDRIPPTLVRKILTELRSAFDYIVVDTPPGFDDHILQAFDETDECVVIATLDVPTIKNTKMALETLDLLHLVEGRRHLVLNRADEEVGLTAASVEDILGMRITTVLPTSLDIPNSTNHGQPIVAHKPAHPVSRGLIALAASFAGESTGPVLDTASPHKRSLFGRRK